jgi:hypothetical protein
MDFGLWKGKLNSAGTCYQLVKGLLLEPSLWIGACPPLAHLGRVRETSRRGCSRRKGVESGTCRICSIIIYSRSQEMCPRVEGRDIAGTMLA